MLCGSGLGQGPVSSSSEHGNETWGALKGGEFID